MGSFLRIGGVYVKQGYWLQHFVEAITVDV